MDEELIIDDLLEFILDNDLENFKEYIDKADINTEVTEELHHVIIWHYVVHDYLVTEENFRHTYKFRCRY